MKDKRDSTNKILINNNITNNNITHKGSLFAKNRSSNARGTLPFKRDSSKNVLFNDENVIYSFPDCEDDEINPEDEILDSSPRLLKKKSLQNDKGESAAEKNLRQSLELLSAKIKNQTNLRKFEIESRSFKKKMDICSIENADTIGKHEEDSDSSLQVINDDPYYNKIAEQLRNDLDKEKIKMYEEAEKIRNLRKINNVEDSVYSNDENILKNLESKSRIIMNPNSIIIKVWEIIILVSTMYFLTITPVIVAFNDLNDYKFTITEVTFEIFFILDIPVNFFTAYYNNEEILVRNKKLIALNYLKKWFTIDLVSSIPTSMIFDLSNISDNKLGAAVSNFTKFLKLFRFIKFLKIVKLLNNTENVDSVSSVTVIDKLQISEALGRIFTFTVTFFIVSHIITCFFIFIGYSESSYNWIINTGLADQDPGEIYIASLYFNWTTLFTTGYGDIIPVNTGERVYVICLMFVGLLVYSFAISALGQVLTTKDDQTKSYMKGIQLLDDFRLKYNNDIPDETYNRCLKYFTYNYDVNKDSTYDLINDFPKKLKLSILFSIHGRITKLFKFFNIRNQDTIGEILDKIKPLRAFKDEDLLIENEMVEEVIFVENGVLSQIITVDGIEIKVAELRRRYYFGDIFCITGQLSPIGIKVCSRHAELFILAKVDIDFKNEDLISDIIDNAKERHFGLLELIELKKFHLEEKKKRVHGKIIENDNNSQSGNSEEGSSFNLSQYNEEQEEENLLAPKNTQNSINSEGSSWFGQKLVKGKTAGNLEIKSSLHNISEEFDDEEDEPPMILDKLDRLNDKQKKSSTNLDNSRISSKKDSISDLISHGKSSNTELLDKRRVTMLFNIDKKKRSSMRTNLYIKLDKEIDVIKKEDINKNKHISSKDLVHINLKTKFSLEDETKRYATDPDDPTALQMIAVAKKTSWVKKAVGKSKKSSDRKRLETKKLFKKRITSDLTDFEMNNNFKQKEGSELGKLVKKQDNIIQFNNNVVSDEMISIFSEQKKMEKMDHQNKRISDLLNKVMKKHG